MKEILYKEEVYLLVGAAMEVHNRLGNGFLEPVYQEAYEYELKIRSIPFTPQEEFVICYRDYILSKKYIADIVAFSKIVIEIKALDQLTSREEAQVLNYLKASGMQLGLLINFGAVSLQWKRIVLTPTPAVLPIRKIREIRG